MLCQVCVIAGLKTLVLLEEAHRSSATTHFSIILFIPLFKSLSQIHSLPNKVWEKAGLDFICPSA